MLNATDSISEDGLIRACQEGQMSAAEILLDRYKLLARREASRLYLPGGDREDLQQEAMIGLLLALRSFDASKGASFSTFATLCIRRQLWKALEAQNRQKQKALNTAVSLDGPQPDADDVPLSDGIGSEAANPERIYLESERYARLTTAIREALSPRETAVFDLYLDGMDYRAMADTLGCAEKSVDNAIQRIRRKVRRLLESL